jgi:hypothetical protein
MHTKSLLLVGSLLFAPALAIAAPDPAPQVVEGNQTGPLTLTEAKQIVAKSLEASGQTRNHVGKAEFVGNGNVAVQVLSMENMPLRQVVVDGTTRQLAATGRTASKG